VQKPMTEQESYINTNQIESLADHYQQLATATPNPMWEHVYEEVATELSELVLKDAQPVCLRCGRVVSGEVHGFDGRGMCAGCHPEVKVE